MTLNIFTSNLIIVIKRFVFCPCLLNLQSQSVFPKALIKNKYKMLLVLTVMSDQYSRRFLWPQAWRRDCCNTEMLFTVWTGHSRSVHCLYKWVLCYCTTITLLWASPAAGPCPRSPQTGETLTECYRMPLDQIFRTNYIFCFSSTCSQPEHKLCDTKNGQQPLHHIYIFI